MPRLWPSYYHTEGAEGMTKKIGVVLVVALIVGFLVPLAIPESVYASETITIYPSHDTYIDEAIPDGNYPDVSALWVAPRYGDLNGSTPILEFDISWGTTIPTGSTITSATLRLFYDGFILGTIEGEYVRVYRLLRTDWVDTSATWTNYKAATAWTSAGATSEGNDYTETGWHVESMPAQNSWAEWNVLEQVEWAQTSNENVIALIEKQYDWSFGATSGARGRFRSSDYTGTAYDPQLVITYTLPVVSPTVSTLSPTPVRETSATLRGYLDDDGNEACSVRFQYGTTTAYGSSTAWDAGYVAGASFSETIYGLVAGTTYHYRAQAVNGEGTVSSGSDETFVTLPYEPYNFTATAGDEEVDLTWSKGTGAVNTMIRRSPTSYPATPSSGTQVYFDTGTSDTDTSLTNGITYYYAAWSYANGEYSSDDANDSATPYAPTAPDCTTNTATNIEATAARLNMHLDDLKGAASATVSLEYYKEGGTPWESETSDSVYTDTGLYYADVAGLDVTSTYYCRAKAVSVHGTGYGDSESFVTGGNAAPTMTTQSATGVMRISATLNGKVADDGGVSVTVWFEWGESEFELNYETASISGLATDDTFYYGLTGLEPNTQYYYRAIGENSVGIGYGVIDDFTTDTAPAPTVRTDGAIPGSNQAVLHGMVLTDGGELCEGRFQYGPTDAYGTDTAWLPDYGAWQAFEQLVTGLEIDTLYHYRAQARNEGGTASGSDGTFTTMFTAPTEFRAKAISHTSISLAWGQSGDMTLIMYQQGGYPADKDDGIQAYFGAGTTATVGSLEYGTTYYFRAWAWREGNVWSANYAGDVATTLSFVDPSEGERPTTVTTPTMPSRWFQAPGGEALENMPLYTQVVELADSLDIPEGSWWFGTAVLIMLVVGGLLWRFTRKATLALIAAGFTVVACSYLGMMPLWFLFVYIAFAGGVTFISQRM